MGADGASQYAQTIAARGFLTGIWDNIGVVKNDGKTGAARFAFPWNLFNDTREDAEFGMRVSWEPLTMTRRGQVLQNVLALTKGMTFESRDPRGTGEFVLSGPGKKLWVWQDRVAWTNHPGKEYSVTGIPRSAARLEVYGWDVLRSTLPLSGEKSVVVKNLPGDETYMFLAR